MVVGEDEKPSADGGDAGQVADPVLAAATLVVVLRGWFLGDGLYPDHRRFVEFSELAWAMVPEGCWLAHGP